MKKIIFGILLFIFSGIIFSSDRDYDWPIPLSLSIEESKIVLDKSIFTNPKNRLYVTKDVFVVSGENLGYIEEDNIKYYIIFFYMNKDIINYYGADSDKNILLFTFPSEELFENKRQKDMRLNGIRKYKTEEYKIIAIPEQITKVKVKED